MEKKLCITVDEMSERLGVGRSMAYQLARRDDFPTIRLGRKMLISTQGLEAWVEKQAGVEREIAFNKEGRVG